MSVTDAKVKESIAPTKTPIFLMSPPRADWALKGKANFRSRQAGPADAQRARQEWSALADAIVEAGGEVLVCPPNPDAPLTGMIYTAEAGELYRQDGQPIFLLPKMASPHRSAEAAWIGPWIEGLGITVDAPGPDAPLWEAQGDAIRAASADQIVHTFGVGPDARTERAAYARVAPLLSPEHMHLQFDADPWFHGNTFLNIYRAPAPSGAHLLVVCPEALGPENYARLRAFLPAARVHEITRAQSLGYDTNALQVRRTVLAPPSLSAGTEAAMNELGLAVKRIELAELFLKGGGAPVCLSNRLWGLRLDEIPDETRWSLHPSIAAHE